MRYSNLRPAEIPADLYNYHLKQLISKDIVEKHLNGYRLTQVGQQHVADVHHTSDQAGRLFKINVITIVARHTERGIEILNQHRTANPSYGKTGVMGGTILKSEPLLLGAARKLNEETGLSAPFRLVGFGIFQLTCCCIGIANGKHHIGE